MSIANRKKVLSVETNIRMKLYTMGHFFVEKLVTRCVDYLYFHFKYRISTSTCTGSACNLQIITFLVTYYSMKIMHKHIQNKSDEKSCEKCDNNLVANYREKSGLMKAQWTWPLMHHLIIVF